MQSTVVIIPNWNGGRFLPTCLDALRRQTRQADEVVLVDNNSTDDSVALVRERFPEVTIVRLAENRFFSVAVNEGVRRSRGEIVVLLNNDTEADPDWLRELVGALEREPAAGMAASKLLLFDRRSVLHSAGDGFGRDGIPRNRGVWQEDHGQFDGSTLVFSPCAAAAAYRRSMLETIGLFDEGFFGYCEDVDLAFRAQLRGYRCIYAPGARVYHRLSATGGGPLASYLCGRNTLFVLAKNLPAGLLRRHWRRILGGQMGIAAEALRHCREPAARARLRGQILGLLRLRSQLGKRRAIQAARTVSDADLESMLS